MTTNRFSVIIALTVIASMAVLTISMLSLPHQATLQRATTLSAEPGFLAQRAGEQSLEAAAAVRPAPYSFRQAEALANAADAVTVQRAPYSFRQAEAMASAADTELAYLSFREGERATGQWANADAAYLQFRQGEWTGN